MNDYQKFLSRKIDRADRSGVAPSDMPVAMKPHQVDSTRFALRNGRAGMYLSTGLGKTFCELEFCRQAAEASNGRALILAPLAVAKQFKREGAKFGYDVNVIRDQSETREGVNVCNYDRLERLDPAAFGAVALDESSLLKSFAGKTSRALRDAFSAHRFRLAASATPAPNDHMELGQQSEFLGVMNSVEMLSKFFINDTSTASQEWRLKGHAEQSFWDWMASWAVMAETPADFGYDASEYILPELNVIRHSANATVDFPKDGLFAADASATNIFAMKKATSAARADEIATAVNAEREPWIVWCNTNDEADDLIARIPDAIEVRGSMSIDQKEDNLEAFATGAVRILITKPEIAGYGMNFQHCARMAFIGRSFSFETWFQAVRRCWRFGQTRPVDVHLAIAEGEDQIGRVIDRKSAGHAKMMRMMGVAMRRALGREELTKIGYDPKHYEELPTWLVAS